MSEKSLLNLLKSEIFLINSCISKISENYFDIGRILFEIKQRGAIEETKYKGYKNIVEFALSEFGFESSKTYNLINVYDKFFKPDKYGSVNKKYYNFSFTQLVYMLNMTEEEILLCKSDMTVRQIKEIRVKKSTRVDSVTVDNTDILKNQIPGQNIISGIFPGKIENEVEENQETIIVSSLPRQQEEKKPETKIIVEVKQTEQNDSFVPIESKEDFYKKRYFEDMRLIEELKDKNSYLIETNKNISSNFKQYSDMIQYIHTELLKLKVKSCDKLINEVYLFYAEGKLPEKLNFIENVI